ncbi:radical SAM domain-containing protein [Cardiosporidium cionae]|uniref:Radical SAM domain-containing protein n=1 Tax=Cardiosporidium cionae TaxID=476202 RepID=A0ABQ7J8S1_9APIC|nr:radical SAM domain-containing protein [Cardiosporidium cionae]|eukprot:KAF8820382.1 radical SAM domain-containing protein [Cardiosporidium cionae]
MVRNKEKWCGNGVQSALMRNIKGVCKIVLRQDSSSIHNVNKSVNTFTLVGNTSLYTRLPTLHRGVEAFPSWIVNFLPSIPQLNEMNKSEPSLFVGKGKSVGLPPSSMKRRKNIFPLPLLDEKALLQAFKNEGIAALHAYTIWRHIIQKGITDVVDIPGLPRKAYALIKQRFVLCTSKLKERKDSKDGSTTKLLITLQDGRSIESVIMRYGAVELSSFPEDKLEAQRSASRLFKSNNRSTLCVSSQVGCQMGCTFCATGTMGLLANLTSGEILEQLYLASQIEKIRNIVFMGMGEPLDNYAEVVLSIRGMMDVRRYNLSSHRITISTVGVVPRIKQLANEIPGVSLALSLHAPTQALRLKIVPSSKAWPIDKLMEAIDFFVETQKTLTATMQRNQFIMIEYVLIADVNDSPSTAHDVGMLLQPRLQRVLLNVIPYNPTNVPMNYRTPSQTSIDTFVDIIRTYDVKVTIRQELGTIMRVAF